MFSSLHSYSRHGEQLKTSERRFKPEDFYAPDVNLEEIEMSVGYFTALTYDEDSRCGRCDCLQPNFGCIVVAVDGACRRNGRPDARSAIGVHFGKESPYNITKILPTVKSNQVAELQAGLSALKEVVAIKKAGIVVWEGEDIITQLVIKADSEYLVKGMTEWIFKWEENGYLNAKGLPVANGELFNELQKEIVKLTGLGVEVQFWHVKRDGNAEADLLANNALDRS